MVKKIYLDLIAKESFYVKKNKSSSLSVLTPLSGFSARRDFLAGGPRRAISEPERLAGPVLHFLGCYRAKVLSHSSALESFAL